MRPVPLALFAPKAAGHDNLAVFGQGFADGVEAFLHGFVDKAAGIDDDEIGTGIRAGNFVTFGAESWVMICSESTRVFGQPREPMPIFGTGVLVLDFKSVFTETSRKWPVQRSQGAANWANLLF